VVADDFRLQRQAPFGAIELAGLSKGISALYEHTVTPQMHHSCALCLPGDSFLCVCQAWAVPAAISMSVGNALFRTTNAFLGLATLGTGAYLLSLMYNAATTLEVDPVRRQTPVCGLGRSPQTSLFHRTVRPDLSHTGVARRPRAREREAAQRRTAGSSGRWSGTHV